MASDVRPVDVERVACDICLKEVPKSEARMAEARDYVAYFCGLDCYDKWKSQREKPAAQAATPGSTGPDP